MDVLFYFFTPFLLYVILTVEADNKQNRRQGQWNRGFYGKSRLI